MTTIWMLALTGVMILQGLEMRHIEKNQKAFESWYPFCEIMKFQICDKYKCEMRDGDNK